MHIVLWHKGEKEDGSDSYSEPIKISPYWNDLVDLICITNSTKKKTNEWVMDYKFNNHKERLSINPSGLETEKMLRFLKEKRLILATKMKQKDSGL